MVVTVALYTMPLARHAPSRGQVFLFLQLQPSELALPVSFRILSKSKLATAALATCVT